ncbi:hypothetical protein [Streptomyces abikoensis]
MVAGAAVTGTAAPAFPRTGPEREACRSEQHNPDEIPVCLIADPCTGLCHLHTLPKDGEYRGSLKLDFGQPVDLTGTVLGMTLQTDRFPRD